MIYIDPPYNTGKDFVYKDNFKDNLQNYMEITGQIGEEGNKISTNSDSSGRYHSNWLNMMYPRLKLARNLLSDDGVIFISIDDNEATNLKKICDEIFGEENLVAQIIAQTNPRGRTFDKYIAKTHEYIIVYTKTNSEQAMFQIPKTDKAIDEYKKEDDLGKFRLLELRNRNPVFNRLNRPNLYYPIYSNAEMTKVSLEKDEVFNVEILPVNSLKEDGCWTWGMSKVRENINLLVPSKASTGNLRVFRKDYLEGSSLLTKSKSVWSDSEINHENGKEMLGKIFNKTPFDFPKSVEYIIKCLQLGTIKENHLILDFFSGSATTAHAVMQLNAEDGGNRKYIMVQLPEITAENSEAYEAGYKNICEIGKERIRRAGEKIKSDESLPLENREKLDIGFKVFKLDSSNIKIWDGTTDNLERTLLDSVDNIKSDRTSLDVLYEILLKYGLDLNIPIVKKDEFYSIGAGTLLINLDKEIDMSIIESICAEYKLLVSIDVDYKSTVVLRDNAFANSVDKSNAIQKLKQAGIKEIRSI